MTNFARGALIAVAAVTVLGGGGGGAASAHPAGAPDSPSQVHESFVDNPFSAHHRHPHSPRYNPFQWGICSNVSVQGHCLP